MVTYFPADMIGNETGKITCNHCTSAVYLFNEYGMTVLEIVEVARALFSDISFVTITYL